jgi:hypothetical protein
MDSLGNIIDNGDSLVPKLIYDKYYGFSLYPQSSIILPFDEGIFFVVTPTASDSEIINYWNVANSGRSLFDLLLYHKVDMKLNGGAGKVVKKAIPLLENVKLSKSQFMACRHANGIDWWLLKQAHDTNMVYRFLVTKDSIYNFGNVGFAEPHFSKWDIGGQSMFNQLGTKYATVCLGLNKLFVADFDRCTAELSVPKVISIANYPIKPPDNTMDTMPRGICFSPNGNFLYVVKTYNIFQYELNQPDSSLAWFHVAYLDTTWNNFQRWGNAYLGPDDKIYIGNIDGLANSSSIINNPDIKGAGCNFCPNCLQFPKIGASMPPCMPNYALGADLPCWSLGTDEAKVEEENFVVYPNPVSTILHIRTEIKKIRELYNSIGQLIMSTWENDSNISHLTRGVYYLKCGDEVRKVIID